MELVEHLKNIRIQDEVDEKAAEWMHEFSGNFNDYKSESLDLLNETMFKEATMLLTPIKKQD